MSECNDCINYKEKEDSVLEGLRYIRSVFMKDKTAGRWKRVDDAIVEIKRLRAASQQLADLTRANSNDCHWL